MTPRSADVVSRDLETIATLIDMAAIALTPTTDATFTADEFFAEAVKYGGPSLELRRGDFDIVLKSYGKVIGKKPDNRLYLR